MKTKKYERLKDRYPDYVSLGQLYQICKISKRSALYLLQNGIIPAVDTQKRTWRYLIAIDDVITYLRKREQWGSLIPRGAVNSARELPKKPRDSFELKISQGEEHLVAEYFQYIYACMPDVLTVSEISEMTGMARDTILRFIKRGNIKPLAYSNRYHIPKKRLLTFLASKRFLTFRSNSTAFKKLIGGFEIWKNAR